MTFFRNWSASELSSFLVFLENDSTSLRQFLGEITYLLQPFVKNAAPGLQHFKKYIIIIELN